ARPRSPTGQFRAILLAAMLRYPPLPHPTPAAGQAARPQRRRFSPLVSQGTAALVCVAENSRWVLCSLYPAWFFGCMPDGSITTFSGVLFRPLLPNPDDIRIADIAHALSQQCRFAGHTTVRSYVPCRTSSGGSVPPRSRAIPPTPRPSGRLSVLAFCGVARGAEVPRVRSRADYDGGAPRRCLTRLLSARARLHRPRRGRLARLARVGPARGVRAVRRGGCVPVPAGSERRLAAARMRRHSLDVCPAGIGAGL